MRYCEGGRSVWVSVEDGENKCLNKRRKGVFRIWERRKQSRREIGVLGGQTLLIATLLSSFWKTVFQPCNNCEFLFGNNFVKIVFPTWDTLQKLWGNYQKKNSWSIKVSEILCSSPSFVELVTIIHLLDGFSSQCFPVLSFCLYSCIPPSIPPSSGGKRKAERGKQGVFLTLGSLRSLQVKVKYLGEVDFQKSRTFPT